MYIAPLLFAPPHAAPLRLAASSLMHGAYELEAALINSRGMAALHESPDDLARNTSESFTGCWIDIPHRLAGLIATEPHPPSIPSTPSTPSTLLISRLAVDPILHRRGIARALLRHIIASNPTSTLLVSTGTANAPALALYESEGFTLSSHSTAPDNTPLTIYTRPTSNEQHTISLYRS